MSQASYIDLVNMDSNAFDRFEDEWNRKVKGFKTNVADLQVGKLLQAGMVMLYELENDREKKWTDSAV